MSPKIDKAEMLPMIPVHGQNNTGRELLVEERVRLISKLNANPDSSPQISVLLNMIDSLLRSNNVTEAAS